MANTKKRKRRIRDWKGLLAEEKRKTKLITFLLILLASTSMTFMQFGFINVGSAGNSLTHVLALLGPIALSALFLGRGWATLEGLTCGAVLFAHARLQPLDLYELYFVGPCNSFLLYTAAGLTLGIAFSIALRNNPKGIRRAVYLAIVSLFVAAFTSVAFIVNMVIDVSVSASSSIVNGYMPPREMLVAISGLGDSMIQMAFDALLVFLLCTLADSFYRRYEERRLYESILSIFRGRLFAVAIIAFVTIQACAFAFITMQSEHNAEQAMEGEIDFIQKQLQTKAEYLEAFKNSNELDDNATEMLLTPFEQLSSAQLVSGYVADDGIVAVFNKDKVQYTNSTAYPVGATIDQMFGKGSKTASQLGRTGTMERVIYSTRSPEELDRSEVITDLELGYMCSEQVGDYIILMSKPATMVFAERYAMMRWASMLAFALLAIMYLLAARLLRKEMAEPIVRTNASLAKIASGDLQAYVAETDSVEFTMLSAGINSTVSALKDFIDEAERRNERDLATAKTIQKSALPRTFPPFPEVDKFDIFASMDAAKEVGGDFYDFFLIDERTLGFLIADVSGKGIPGALFMMAAKTEIENYLATGMSPAEAIASANKRLCANNDAGMFVTVWAATLNYNTGELTYVNAGHNFPLLRHGSGGEWEWLKKKCGLFLGTFETAKYRQETLTLKPGDEILLYTDGVNEAFNINEEEYGNDRLDAFVAAHNNLHARDLVRSLRSDVAAWAEGAEQSDDVTILALEFGVSPEVTGSITVPATLDQLEKVAAMIEEELEKRLCPIGAQRKIEVALEELFVNVCRYAYANQREPGTVMVSYAYSTNPSAMTIELRDQGIPFDPLTREDPTKPASIQETKVGGLGIFMVKKSMDDFMYMYDKGSNVVVFKKGW